jgi:diguanylate cyclase (GGDEF)-like protein
MLGRFQSLDDLKRGIYLWVLPFVALTALINFITTGTRALDLFVNGSLVLWFTLSWFWAYLKKSLRFGEYSNLMLITVYHLITVYDIIHNNLARTGSGALGDFIIWVPLYFMFIFITLGIKKGLWFAITVFLLTFIFGIIDFRHLSAESIDSITQFYFANVVYILVLYFAQHLYRSYTEVALLKKHAYIDSLTNIANRHQIDVWLEEKLEAAEEEGKAFSIIFFDIDHFKKVNDVFGHKIGDCVLKELSAIVSGNLSDGDNFGRWGGEEFILITDSTNGQAYEKAEHFRKMVENHCFKGAGSLTASFGVTDYQSGENIDSLLNRADEALYVSKNGGRNKVSVN